MDRQQAIELMNLYGKHQVPFFFMVDFEMKNCFVKAMKDIHHQELLFAINGKSNIDSQNIPNQALNYFEKHPILFEVYEAKFEKIIKHIKEGDTYLINLTCPTPISMNLTLKDIFYQSNAKYRLWYKDEFVVFSPEIFVQIIDNQIFSFPMKGTIDADLPHAEARILADEKEKAEHATIVDLIRNDLSMIAEKVHVEQFRYVEKIETHQQTLLQVSSKIVGSLPENYKENLGNLIFTLLPAGSISGAPKKKTVEIILEIEQYERGYYTGIMGIFDGKNLDSGVMIRFIEQTINGLAFKSGGGITYKSQAKLEYQEMIDKVYVPIIRNN
ncbi:MAG: aminodeoxychorismate synthase component I [Thermoflexibacter sp.]|jgi:para-aminobenzoate synthetase component 1|nr:aminodeoxychorismate synthase component I [Thermoflexibacter sp.]